jgi:DNA-directed RNA polymerase subunit E"
MHCPGAPVTTDWQGFVVILYPERSEVAKKLNVTEAGNYALKVNIR